MADSMGRNPDVLAIKVRNAMSIRDKIDQVISDITNVQVKLSAIADAISEDESDATSASDLAGAVAVVVDALRRQLVIWASTYEHRQFQWDKFRDSGL